MWVEDQTIQTWVNGGKVILKKVCKDYAFRLANEAGDWMDYLTAWCGLMLKPSSETPYNL